LNGTFSGVLEQAGGVRNENGQEIAIENGYIKLYSGFTDSNFIVTRKSINFTPFKWVSFTGEYGYTAASIQLLRRENGTMYTYRPKDSFSNLTRTCDVSSYTGHWFLEFAVTSGQTARIRKIEFGV